MCKYLLMNFFRMKVAILIAAFSATVNAQSNLVVYDDDLRNGFLNWSWAYVDTDFSQAKFEGTSSCSVNIISGFQALCFYHFPMSTTPYKSIRFSISGGLTGGQIVYAQCQSNNVFRKEVKLNPLVKNTWHTYEIPLKDLGVENVADLTAFLLRDSNGTALPTFYVDAISFVAKPVPASGNVIEANPDRLGSKVDARMFGVNVAAYYTGLDDPGYAKLLKDSGLGLLRFPGGFYTNLYHWQTNTLHGTNEPTSSTLDQFLNLLNMNGSAPNFSVNYGSGTAAEAAAWVQYVNKTKGVFAKYWDVGNENNGTNQPDFHARRHDPYTYATEFASYYRAMKAVDSRIKIGAVVCSGEDTYDNGYRDHPARNPRTGVSHYGWTPVVLATLKAQGIKPDYVIFHRYAQAPDGENDAVLLNSGSGWSSEVSSIRSMLNDYLTPVSAADVEIVCGEHNSVYTDPGKQSVSLVNGLYYAEALGQAMQTEMKGLTWWTFRENRTTNGNMSSSLYGWRNYGSYGMTDSRNDPFPTYYGALMVRRWAKPGDQIIQCTSNNPQLSAYAISNGGKAIKYMVINKHPTLWIEAAMQAKGRRIEPEYTMHLYGISNDQAARTGQGVKGPETFAITVADRERNVLFPPYSITVLTMEMGPGGNEPVTRKQDNQ